MNDAQLDYFRQLADNMRPGGSWIHVGPNGHMHTGLTKDQAEARVAELGGEIEHICALINNLPTRNDRRMTSKEADARLSIMFKVWDRDAEHLRAIASRIDDMRQEGAE